MPLILLAFRWLWDHLSRGDFQKSSFFPSLRVPYGVWTDISQTNLSGDPLTGANGLMGEWPIVQLGDWMIQTTWCC